MTSRESRDFPDRVLLKHKSKLIEFCCVFKFLWLSVDGKLLHCFQSETSVFKFLRRRLDGASSIHTHMHVFITNLQGCENISQSLAIRVMAVNGQLVDW